MKSHFLTRQRLFLGTTLSTGLLAALAVQPVAAQTVPTGGAVASGTATITPTATNVTVDIGTGAGNNPVVTWTTFSLGGGGSATFTSADTAVQHSVLNRVIGGATIFPSIIDGPIDAGNGGNNNIAVWLVNPAGITFSTNGTYSGGSLILSTLLPGGLNTFPTAGNSVTFDVATGLTYDVSATKVVAINKPISTQGSLLIIGQAVSVAAGANLTASNGTVTIAAGDKITFASGVDSPLKFTVDTGSTLAAGGVQIGNASISGKSVTIAAVTQTVALATALKVDTGATLTAAGGADGVTLATKGVGQVSVTTPNANDTLDINTGTAAGTGLVATGGSPINIAGAGTVSLNGNITATGAGSTSTISAAALSLVGGATNVAGDITYDAPVTLKADTAIKTTTGTAIFKKTVDSDALATPRKLDITGNGEFDDKVGATFPLKSLTVSGTTKLSGGQVFTTDNQTYTGGVTLGAPTTTLDSTANDGAISLGAVTGGGNDLTVKTGAGAQTFNGLATIGTLTLNGTGTRTINAGTYSWATLTGGTLGKVTTNGAIVLGQATTFGTTTLGSDTTISGAAVNFTSTVDATTAGGQALTVSNDVTFGDKVGAGKALKALSVTGKTNFAAAATSVTTFNNQTYTGAVTLGADTTLDSTANNGTIALGPVSGSAFKLVVKTNAGGQTLNGVDVDTLTLNGTGLRTINAGTYKWNTLTGGTLGTVTTNGAIVLGQATTFGTTTLGSDTAISGAAVNFTSTIDATTAGGQALSVGDVTFGDKVGNTTALKSLSVTGNTALNTSVVKTTGSQSYTGPVLLGANAQLTGSTVSFGSTLDSAGADRDLTITGAAVFGGAVGSIRQLNSLTVTGTTAINGGSVNSGLGQTYQGAVKLGATTVLTSGTTVDFQSTLDSAVLPVGLTINGNAKFGGAVGGIVQLATLKVTGATAINGGSVSTSANQTYQGAVTLGANTTLTTGGLVDFQSTLDSAVANRDLTVAGNARFGGAVGNTLALKNLKVTGTSAINGGLVKTTDSQTYQGQVTLGANTTLDATANNGDISLAFVSGPTYDLNVSNGSGKQTYNGFDLHSIAFNGTGLRTINGGFYRVVTPATLNFGNVTTNGVIDIAQPTSFGITTLGSDTTITSNPVANQFMATFTGTVDATTAGAQKLDVQTNATFGDNIGFNKALNSLSVTGTTTFGAAATSVTTTTTQSYTGDVTLGASMTLTGSTVTFGGKLDTAASAAADRDLTITGKAVFKDLVGMTRQLNSLTVTGTSDINGTKIKTGLGQTYKGAVTLTADTELISGGLVDFQDTLDSDTTARTLLVTGNAQFGKAVGSGTPALKSLTVTGTSAINGGSVTTTTSQSYQGAATLGADTALNGTSVSFGNTLDSAGADRDLTINAAATFAGQVGSIRQLKNLTVNGTTAINPTATQITTSVNQTYNGAVTLGTDTTLTSATGLVKFVTTVDSASPATPQSLTVQGNALFVGDAGGTNKLNIVTVKAPQTIDSSAKIVAQGAIKLDAGTSVNATSLTTTAATSDILINTTAAGTGSAAIASNVSSGQNLIVKGTTVDLATTATSAVTQTAAGKVDITATAGNITGGSSSVAGNQLTLTSNSGNSSAANYLVLDAFNGTTVGTAITFAPSSVLNAGNAPVGLRYPNAGSVLLGDVTAGMFATVDVTHTVFTSNPMGANLKNLTAGKIKTISPLSIQVSGTLDVISASSTGGSVTLQGAIVKVGNGDPLSVSSATQFTMIGSSGITLAGTFSSPGGTQSYTGPVTLSANVNMVGSTMSFTNAATTINGPFALDIAGSGVFNGAIGNTAALTTLHVSGSSAINGGTVNTTSTQKYDGAVTIGADTTMNGSALTFGSTLDGPHTLAITGNTLFGGAVGGSAALTSLTVNGTSAINGGSVKTTGAQSYKGAVTLGKDTTLTASTVGFTSTVDGAFKLDIAADATFGGAVGGSATLTSLSVSGTSAINGGSVKTTGTQTYTGAATLGADTTLTGSGVTFGSTLNSDATARQLAIQGNAVFGGAVGGTSKLAKLTVSGTSAINGGAVSTTGDQTYTGAATLGADTTLSSTSGTVSFGNTLDSFGSARALVVNGNLLFGGKVGSGLALNSLTVSGTSALNGGPVTTIGGQTYTGAVTLGTATALAASGVTFGSTVDGAQSLAITGNATFGGAVGSGSALTSLSVSGTSAINGKTVVTTGDQTYSGPATLGDNTTLTGRTIGFGSTLDSQGADRSLAINGNARFGGAVGNIRQLTTLTISGTTALNGSPVKTSSDQTYGGAVTLGADAALNSGGVVEFKKTVDSDGTPRSLSVTVGSNALFDDRVGATSPIKNLTVTAPGKVIGTSLATTGTTTVSGGGAVQFTSVNAGGATSITGGGAVTLASVSSGGATTITGAPLTISGTTSSGGATVLKSTSGDLTLGAVTSAGDTTLTTPGKATLAAVTATGKAVTLSAADADLGGLITASTATIIDNGAAGNTLRLGDGPSGSGGFQLSNAELNNLAAANVVLDAGTGTGLNRQDVAIGTVNLTNSALKTLAIYGLQRLDLTAPLTTASGVALTSLQLGGTGTASDQASVIRIAAKTNGTGGLINIGTGRLILRGSSIGVGLDAGFLDALGVTAGGTPNVQTATLLVTNPSSALYNSQLTAGGNYDQVAGRLLIVAGSMSVSYTNFALFQNTALIGNDGVVLASAAAPTTSQALALNGPNPPATGPFALFGSINGVINTATALLGPTIIQVNPSTVSTTARINGCLIGSGAGCISSATLPTSLINILPSRTTLILANSDFEVPFDPLVATNNDTLFGDVGTFGLGDIVDTPVDCQPDGKTTCDQPNGGTTK